MQNDIAHQQINSESRLERGRRVLSEIDGEAGEKVISALADVAPDFARYLFEFPFGDIYSRPGLDIRSREIATVAALTAMGNALPQLKGSHRCGTECRPESWRDSRNYYPDVGICPISRRSKRIICREGSILELSPRHRVI